MARARTQAKGRPDWLLVNFKQDGTTEMSGHIWYVDDVGELQSHEWRGLDGVPAAVKNSARTAIINLLKAKMAFLLSTEPTTHEVVFQDGEFVEQVKP